MIKINLLPEKSIKKDVKNKEFVVVSALSLLVVLGVVAFLNTRLSAKLDAREAKIEQINKEIAELDLKVKEVESYKSKNQQLGNKIKVIKELQAKKTGPVKVLDKLSMEIPEEVWVDAYQDTAGALKLTGAGLDDEKISDFLKKLEASPQFCNVELQFIRPRTIGKKRVRAFEINANLNCPG